MGVVVVRQQQQQQHREMFAPGMLAPAVVVAGYLQLAASVRQAAVAVHVAAGLVSNGLGTSCVHGYGQRACNGRCGYKVANIT